MILREYQEDIKSQVYAAWDSGTTNVLLVMPTGAGKTKSFCSIVIDKAVTPLNKLPTAILVHRKELVAQISLTLAEEGVKHNIIAPRPVILGIIAAQRKATGKQFYDHMAPITVVSVDTINSRIDRHENWAKSIKFWITDEAAHLLVKNKWGRAVSFFPNAIGLGVTATPQRLDKRGLGRHADGVFDAMVEGPTTRWLINNKYLSKYRIAVPASDYQRYLKKASSDADYTREAMTQASTLSKITGDVVENYTKFANGKQAIVFTTDIETAHKMEAKFSEAGIKAKTLTGLTPDAERLEGMNDFRDKRVQVLINVDLFDEGLDVPGIECVIMARPTMSLGKYLQMIGRGLRVSKDKPHLIIIDHVGNVTTHGLPCQVRKWTLDRIVKRRDKTNLIRICSNYECNAPYDRALTTCPWCGEEAISTREGGGGGRIPPVQVDGDLMLMDPETLRELEESTVLEDPGVVAERVARVAGMPAGVKAMKNQRERIETQKNLADSIALWAGKKKQLGYSDREIHKLFYLEFDGTITFAMSQPRKDMLDIIERLSTQ